MQFFSCVIFQTSSFIEGFFLLLLWSLKFVPERSQLLEIIKGKVF